ncbi:MAG: AMP-binding protein [Actinomycetes bacterium]
MPAAAARRAATARTLVEVGVLRPQRPDRMLLAALRLLRWRTTQAAAVAVGAARHPDRAAVVDERGTCSFRELHERTNALARGFAATGLSAGEAIGILCRNHQGMVEAMLAAGKLGLHVIFLNTMFAGPQLAAACEREGVRALVHDEEFGALVASAAAGLPTILAWSEAGAEGATLDRLVAEHDRGELAPPAREGRLVILTSGTTGSPKGAARRQPASLDPVATFLEAIPLRAREVTVVAAPLFHSWGLLTFSMGLAIGSTQVLRRRFDPEATLADVAAHRAAGLVVVPLMLQRMLELPSATLEAYDVSSLRVVAASGSALPGDLALRVMDRFGDVLHNFYGSTEVAWVSVAAPADLRAAPGTSGRPPRGTVLRLVDDDGKEVAPGTTGRIFVGNDMLSDGYTDGGGKESLDGLLATGDVGHLDEAGRLFVDGRDDDMIVSGGENVFPREVEDLLADHPKVADVGVVGVTDAKWGQRLRAVVVLAPGQDADEAELQAHVREHLAGFKVPREIIFADELPRNATGKIVARELPGA